MEESPGTHFTLGDQESSLTLFRGGVVAVEEGAGELVRLVVLERE